MTIYDRLTSASTRMLAPVASGGKGALVTITTLGTPGEYDEATDTQTPGTPTTQTGSGVEDAVSAYSVVNGLAQAGDVKFLLSPMTSDAYGRSTGTPRHPRSHGTGGRGAGRSGGRGRGTRPAGPTPA